MNEPLLAEELLHETESMEKVEQYQEQHKKAFRITFDFLKKHFPPQNNPEWWTAFSNDVSILAYDNRDNLLCTALLTGIMNYLHSLCTGETVWISENAQAS